VVCVRIVDSDLSPQEQRCRMRFAVYLPNILEMCLRVFL
jgi:hypothetical protein